MTGVEKVREWAEETMEDVNGDDWPRCACLTYGAYLKGLIDGGVIDYPQKGWQVHRYDKVMLCQYAIAAWKETMDEA